MWLLQNYFWNSFVWKSLITIIQYIWWIQNLERPKINITDNQKPKTNKQFTLLHCSIDVIIQNYWWFGDGLIKICKLGYCPITNPFSDGRYSLDNANILWVTAKNQADKMKWPYYFIWNKGVMWLFQFKLFYYFSKDFILFGIWNCSPPERLKVSLAPDSQ